MRKISDSGHEIASHGYSHELIYNQNRNEFLEETKKSKNLIEDIIGNEVIGYRASNWSIIHKSLWALDILQDIGFKYDSSIYPTKNYLYGIPSAPVNPYFHSNGLLEIPPTVFKALGHKVPFSGGFFLRAMPSTIVRFFLKKINLNGHSVVFYIHPWELDELQPKNLNIQIKNKIIHYYNIKKTEKKLRKVFEYSDFTNIKKMLPIIQKQSKFSDLL